MKRIKDKILEVFFSDTWLGAILWFCFLYTSDAADE